MGAGCSRLAAMLPRLPVPRLAGIALLWFCLAGADPRLCADTGSARDPGSIYLYEETRRLVRLVEDAARLVEKRGDDAFKEFARPGSRWFTEHTYFFVYDTEGVCVFHPMSPNLVGQNLDNLKDFYGKPIIRHFTALAQRPEPAAADWFFYLWEEGTQFFPMWKTSYVRKAIAPSGRVLLVGSGVYNLRVEREFVRRQVDAAAELLAREGRAEAFRQFNDLSTRYVFLNTYIFVLDLQGNALVDPAFPTLKGRSLLGFRDAVGHPVVQEMITKLSDADEAWVQYKWPLPGSRFPSRKVAYIRKVGEGDDALIVGSDFFMASPVWMKL
ncbi:MAG: Cache, type 2 domain protein [Rariglobus sp.]|jgi:signal transduction histidine kinase|nr:Cache, type 2 domain protein [Rariglobus sp.]